VDPVLFVRYFSVLLFGFIIMVKPVRCQRIRGIAEHQVVSSCFSGMLATQKQG
jgi:hypothetical protein